MSADTERRARAALSFLAAPGDPVLGAALRAMPPSQLLAVISGAGSDGTAALAAMPPEPALARAVGRWRDRLGEVPSVARLAAWQHNGLRLVMPGDAEWPSQLDDLGDTRPVLLWLRGTGDLRLTCVNSVSMVGSRAATGYGSHVAIEMAATLAERGVGVISGGAKATFTQVALNLRSPGTGRVGSVASGGWLS